MLIPYQLGGRLLAMGLGRHCDAWHGIASMFSSFHHVGSFDAEVTPKALGQEALRSMLISTGLMVQQIPGAGRGIVTPRDISYGEILHREQPVLCVPSIETVDKVCTNCLAVIEPPLRSSSRQQFCSTACKVTAERRYLKVVFGDCMSIAVALTVQVYQTSDFTRLEKHCRELNERFPLLSLRAACMMLSSAQLPFEGSSLEGSGITWEEERRSLQSAVHGLDLLSFVNTGPQPPEPWVESYALFRKGLQPYLDALLEPQAAPAHAIAESLTLAWWTSLLARFHINVFRVDAVLPPAPGESRAALAAAAAALLGDNFEERSGSAVYLLASFFNHSCSPNLSNGFPYNNGTAVFTAARDIQSGEELTITYINNHLPVTMRQEQLKWAYGFDCSCNLCREELCQL